MYSFQGQSPVAYSFGVTMGWSSRGVWKGRIYIYMVELSLGTPGCYPLPLPFNFLLARYWDMHGAWLAPYWNHTCCTVQEDLSRVEQLSPTLAVHLLQQSFLLCWAMDVPAVCVGSWMGALGALPGRRGGEAAVQTEGLCSEGCWALGKLRSHKAACV